MFFLVVIMYALMALAFAFGKWATACTTLNSPAYVIAFRMIPVGLAFIAYHFYKVKRTGKFRWRDVPLFFLVGLMAVYLHLVPEYWSMKYMATGKASLIYSLFPFITAFLSYFIISERLNAKQWTALGIGFIGIIPIVLTHNPGELNFSTLFSVSTPELAMLFSTFSIASVWFIVRLLSMRGYSLHLINGMGMLIGGFLCAGHFFTVHGMQFFPVVEPFNFIWLSIALVVVSNVTTYNMYAYLLTRFSATFLSFAACMLPVFGVIYGRIIWGEAFKLHYLAAFALITAGLWLYHVGSLEKGESALLK